MRIKEDLNIDVVKKVCKAVGGQSEVARYMGRKRQYVANMLKKDSGYKFHLGLFLKAFKKMDANKIIHEKISYNIDLATKLKMIESMYNENDYDYLCKCGKTYKRFESYENHLKECSHKTKG